MMNRMLLIVALVLVLFGFQANASVTWSFAGSSNTLAQGTAFTVSGQTIKVYGEQMNLGTNTLMATPVTQGGVATLGGSSNALFQTNTAFFNLGSGIGPFDPAEGGTAGPPGTGDGFPNQLGIDNDVVHDSPAGGQYSNVLELYLDSSIANGSVLNFLIQGPTTDPVGGAPTTVAAYTANASTPQSLSAMTLLPGGPFGGISTTGTLPQFSITKSFTNEFVAIQADCHYILLDTITTNGSLLPTPEPGFFGVVLLAVLGIGIVARKRRAAEQA